MEENQYDWDNLYDICTTNEVDLNGERFAENIVLRRILQKKRKL